MIFTIKNQYLTVDISDHGAEIQSIKSVKTDIEYLWQGNPTYWRNRATVIFPVCGRLCQNKYTYQGETYEMLIHGFAKLCDFEVESHTDTKVVFVLTANDFTRRQYPFEFTLKLEYSLDAGTITQRFTVTNNDEKTLIFSCGGHPGFNAPFTDGEQFEDYYLEFARPTTQYKVQFSPDGLCTGERTLYPLINDKIIPLSHGLFDGNEPFLQGDCKEISLKSKKNGTSITLKYDDMATLGTWQTEDSDAKFICIEPWCGLPATTGIVDDLETKNMMEKLQPGGVWTSKFTITVQED